MASSNSKEWTVDNLPMPTDEDQAQPDAFQPPDPNGVAERPIHFYEIAPAIEFCCWVVLALAPFLRWVNGVAVTDDQFVIQCTLVALAASGAIGLRVYNWRVARQAMYDPNDGQSQRE